MSYLTLRTNHYFTNVCRSASLTPSTNYAVISGSSITNGFPYDSSGNNNGIPWTAGGNYLTIPVKGLYCVSVGFNINNNDSNSGDDTIFVGFVVSNSADNTHTSYTQGANPEYFQSGYKSSTHVGLFLELNAGDRIRGSVTDSGTLLNYMTTDSGRASNYMSVALIVPFT
jgi:hypothetical protein